MNPLHWIASCFYIGRIPHLGTSIATLIGLISAIAIRHYWNDTVLLIAAIVVFFIGLIASSSYLKTGGGPDEIVVDEIAGIWITLVLLHNFGYVAETKVYIAAFFAFRIFDGIKIWPIDIIEEKAGGAFGAMFDDIISGFYAFIGVVVLLFFYNALLT